MLTNRVLALASGEGSSAGTRLIAEQSNRQTPSLDLDCGCREPQNVTYPTSLTLSSRCLLYNLNRNHPKGWPVRTVPEHRLTNYPAGCLAFMPLAIVSVAIISYGGYHRRIILKEYKATSPTVGRHVAIYPRTAYDRSKIHFIALVIATALLAPITV